jgi:hypothetical protein
MVQTSMYQYILLVQLEHGTGQYENSSESFKFVQGGMYQYTGIPGQAFNKTCGFPTHPERVGEIQ